MGNNSDNSDNNKNYGDEGTIVVAPSFPSSSSSSSDQVKIMSFDAYYDALFPQTDINNQLNLPLLIVPAPYSDQHDDESTIVPAYSITNEDEIISREVSVGGVERSGHQDDDSRFDNDDLIMLMQAYSI